MSASALSWKTKRMSNSSGNEPIDELSSFFVRDPYGVWIRAPTPDFSKLLVSQQRSSLGFEIIDQQISCCVLLGGGKLLHLGNCLIEQV